MSIRLLLRDLRKAAGLTQGQLGERVGRAQTSISDLETGANRIDPLLCGLWLDAVGATSEERRRAADLLIASPDASPSPTAPAAEVA